MDLSRTTIKKAHPYHGICEFCGRVHVLSYYDLVLECAVCEECAEDLASGENELIAAVMASPAPESFDGVGFCGAGVRLGPLACLRGPRFPNLVRILNRSWAQPGLA